MEVKQIAKNAFVVYLETRKAGFSEAQSMCIVNEFILKHFMYNKMCINEEVNSLFKREKLNGE